MIEKAAHSSTYRKKRGLNSVNSKHTDPAASPAVLRLLAVGAVLWSPPRVDQSSLLIGRRHSSQYLHQNLGCYSNTPPQARFWFILNPSPWINASNFGLGNGFVNPSASMRSVGM